MPSNADEIIASLDAFAANDDGNNVEALYRILEDFDRVSERQRVLPAIFRLMERYPEADLGSPGPLVHAIERLPIAEYEPMLRKSVQRQPGELNVWMVNRILNARPSAQLREDLLGLLHAAIDHPLASVAIRQAAARFLKLQVQRRTD